MKVLDLRKGGEVKVLLDPGPTATPRDPELRFDGKQIVFSMRKNKADDYHIYVVDTDGSGLKQLTSARGVFDIDPLYLANEGKLLAFVSSKDTPAVLAAIKANPYGKDAAVIGEVVADNIGKVIIETRIGGVRIVDMLAGEQLPRIC